MLSKSKVILLQLLLVVMSLSLIVNVLIINQKPSVLNTDENTNSVIETTPIITNSIGGGTVSGYEGLLYYGQEHNHANAYGDDGQGTVAENMAYMKTTATPAMDFGGLSPHAHLVTSADMLTYWSEVRAANSAGSFVAITGQEWSTLSTSNHVNVYYASERCAVTSGDIPGFYSWLITSGSYAAFNHPWSDDGNDMNNWQYYASADKPGNFAGKMIAMEMKQGTGYTTGFDDYIEALNNGWHIGMLVSDDEHTAHPGDKFTNSPRTGMWLTSFTENGIKEAMQELRFFGAQDSTGYVDLQCGTYSMGDVFKGTAGMTLEAKLNSALTYTSVQIYIDGTAYTMTNAGGGVYTYTVDASAKHYYFVRAKTSDNNYIISSPMWSDPNASTPGVDVYPPAITAGPVATPVVSSATITWTTNETANAQVVYGTSSNVYGLPVTVNNANATSHSVTITGLTAATQYFCRVKSWDQLNNGPVTSNEFNFNTTATDTTPPQIVSGPVLSSIGVTSAVISWTTNEISDAYIEWGTSTGVYPSSQSDNANNGTNHQIMLQSLNSNTTYYYRVKSYDLAGLSVTSAECNFTTLVATAGVKPFITEIMMNPSAVSDANGEWFELYNPGTSAIDLYGWTLMDVDIDKIAIQSSVILAGNSYIVLGCNSNSGTNGGVTVDYSFLNSEFALANAGDEIILLDDSSEEVDRVVYSTTSPWQVPAGASLALMDYSADNNVGSNWAPSTIAWSGSTGDKGSPRAHNPGAAIPGVSEFDLAPMVFFALAIIPILIQRKRVKID